MRRVTALLVLGLLLTTVTPALAAPVSLPLGSGITVEPPRVGATTWLLYDDTLDLMLASDGIDEPRPMASTTKVMTALLVMERADLDDVVTISPNAVILRGSIVRLHAGEKLTVRQLLMGLLMRSGNDTAIALAEHVAGSSADFVAMMNERARELGMVNTRFANTNGLDTENHYSSARDLLILERAAMEHTVYRQIGALRGALLPPHPDGTVRYLRQTNALVREGFEGAFSGKTGDTPNANRTFVGGAERDGRRLYVVVMGTDDHMADARALLDHGFVNFPLHGVLARNGGVELLHQAGDDTASALVAPTTTTTSADPGDDATDVTDGETVVAEPIDPPGDEPAGTLPGPVTALRWWFDQPRR